MTQSSKHYDSMLVSIQSDPRYLANLDWGKPRNGHPEGAIRAHIAELEQNLRRLRHKLTDLEIAKLRVLIHVHDTFKPDAAEGVAISHPHSHASLAKSFLAEFCDDCQMQAIVQFHDEPYALWLQHRSGRPVNAQRWSNLLETITDWTVFLAFLIVDGCTRGKNGEPVRWYFSQLPETLDSRIDSTDIP